jgi:hypothetical protein
MSGLLRSSKLLFGVAAIVLAAVLVVTYIERPELEEVADDECEHCGQVRDADAGEVFGEELLRGGMQPKPRPNP